MFDLAQNTPEWLDFRRDKIGASDAPVIMGDSPWATPLKRWQEKLGLCAPKEQTFAMRRGLESEGYARDAFAVHTDIVISPKVLVHPEIPWMIASMDGVSLCGTVGVEIKTPGRDDHATAKERRVPKKYYAQLQHQHEVGRFKKLYYASLGKDGDFVYFEVPRDDVYIADLLEKEKKFYECLSNFEQPALCNSDYSLHLDDEFKAAACGWVAANDALKKAKALENDYRKKLIDLCAGANARCGDVVISSYPRRGAVDYSAVPELFGVDLDRYRKESLTCWKIEHSMRK